VHNKQPVSRDIVVLNDEVDRLKQNNFMRGHLVEDTDFVHLPFCILNFPFPGFSFQT